MIIIEKNTIISSREKNIKSIYLLLGYMMINY